jgi:thiamine-phosphate pyrophosphorylase
VLAALPFRLLLLTDEAACARAGRSVAQTVARALPVDASDVAVLLRAKELTPAALLEQAKALREITGSCGALLVVHGDPEIARLAGADGVHLPDRTALPVGAGALAVSASRHRGAPLDDEDTLGLRFVILAPIFAPRSKPLDLREPLGLPGLWEHALRSKVPLVALGGLDPTSGRACLEAGAGAVAVLGGVMGAAEPERAVEELLAALSPRGR